MPVIQKLHCTVLGAGGKKGIGHIKCALPVLLQTSLLALVYEIQIPLSSNSACARLPV